MNFIIAKRQLLESNKQKGKASKEERTAKLLQNLHSTTVMKKVIDEFKKKDEPISFDQRKAIPIMSRAPLNELEEDDIGTYVEFTLADLEKYFRGGNMFGDYVKTEIPWTKKFALMATEESVKIINYLNNI